MQRLCITGGRTLSGQVSASGSKNAALPIVAATILSQQPVTIERVPDLTDVRTLADILRSLAVEVRHFDDGSMQLKPPDDGPARADYELVRRMRAGFCVLGPLLARRGRAVVSLPGGCAIGDRPVDLHLSALAALGANIKVEHGYVVAEAEQLNGAQLQLTGPRGPTVTGTANALSAAVLSRGETVLHGAAVEPEIVDLGRFLISLGARIEGLGTSTIRTIGVDRLGADPSGIRYKIIPDRIEAATLLLAVAITGGRATVDGIVPGHMGSVLAALREAGCHIEVENNGVTIQAPRRPNALDITAAPYPGIPTDIQAQWMALLATADGPSTIRDRVFPDRFMHIAELNRLSANIQRSQCGSNAAGIATVNGVERLTGATVSATDLRASAALVLAGLAAEGQTIVLGLDHLDRGYERLDRKLIQLGANIKRVCDI